MTEDGVIPRERLQVVHEARLGAESPKRSRPHLVSGVARSVLHNAVARAHVMQKEIAEGMDNLAPQGGGYGESSTVDDGARRRRGDRGHVANGAANRAENLLAILGGLRCQLNRIYWWCIRGSHEGGKVIDVREMRHRIVVVFRIRNVITDGRRLSRLQPAGDTLLVEVGVSRKREQAGLLILPAEASATDLSGSLEHGHLDELTGNATAALVGLVLCNGKQRVAVDGLDEPVAQSIERRALGSNGFAPGHALLRLRTDRPIIDQRTVGYGGLAIVDDDVGVHEDAAAVVVANAKLRNLTGAARHGVLVAIYATPGVIKRTQATIHAVFLFEGVLVLGQCADAVRKSVTRALRAGVSLKSGSRETRGRVRETTGRGPAAESTAASGRKTSWRLRGGLTVENAHGPDYGDHSQGTHVHAYGTETPHTAFLRWSADITPVLSI